MKLLLRHIVVPLYGYYGPAHAQLKSIALWFYETSIQVTKALK
jgi:hypothetical protein